MIIERIRPIKTQEDYENALKRIEQLMDAKLGTPEGDELEVLSTLVDLYEEEHFPVDLPSPVDAIRFRMEQEGLSNRDLEPYIGSRGKVSEVLSEKRPLTLQMIRALHTDLGIPAEVLLQRPGASLPESPTEIDWRRFPIRTMRAFGWVDPANPGEDRAEEIVRELIEQAGGFDAVPEEVLFRKNEHARQNAKMDSYALRAWSYKLMAIARGRERELSGTFREGSVTMEFCRDLVKNSWSKDGPKLAKEYLEKNGIQLIHLRHLPHIHLDGAALQLPNGGPVIGLTLRYDRLDNFWFCVCHELAHVALHMKGASRSLFVDDLRMDGRQGVKLNDREREADEWAQEALIPSEEWEHSGISQNPPVAAVLQFAHTLGVHPAIIAGRVRKETRNYRLLTHYVGNREVSKQF